MPEHLSNEDYAKMDDFLIWILDGYKNGDISRDLAVANIAHVMTALDERNIGEVISSFTQIRS